MTNVSKDMVVFGEDWGGLPSSTQHLIKRIAKGRKIIWVNSIGLRSPKLSKHDLVRAFKKMTAIFIRKNNTHDIPHNISVLSVMTLPAPKSKLSRYVAMHLTCWQVKKRMDALGIESPVLWTSLPTVSDIIGKLNESASIYYCGDDFSALAGVDHKVVAEHEKKLSQKCDLIITASDELKRKFQNSDILEETSKNGQCHCVTHGVDFDLFNRYTPIAEDLKKIKRDGKPVAGFYGSIAEWLDLDLLTQCIKDNRDWNFVFIGKENVDMSSIKQFSNVFFLGPKKHEILPSYSQHWEVSILPFKDNEQIRSCNPLKMREYLAAGTAVISTYFPAAEQYSDVIDIVETPEDFSQSLKNIARGKSIYSVSETVRTESWDEKAKQVEQLMESLPWA